MLGWVLSTGLVLGSRFFSLVEALFWSLCIQPAAMVAKHDLNVLNDWNLTAFKLVPWQVKYANLIVGQPLVIPNTTNPYHCGGSALDL
jgi:hypothetical protein